MTDEISSIPVMDQGGFDCFRTVIACSQCYLEYGCGGSTVHACQAAQVRTVISVDSDRRWADRVRTQLQGASTNLLLTHCDIGDVGDWGTPRNRDRIDSFWQYMVAPWSTARSHNLVPDTILIDGRFRVACFLYSLLSARVGTTILFDDYFDRPQYFAVEKFCRVAERHERMALFTVAHDYAVPDIVAAIAQYSVRWD